MSLTLKYIDAPEDAQEALTVTAQGGSKATSAQSIAAGAADIPWATLEPGVWRLDGSRKLLEDTSQPGWWSAEASGRPPSRGTFRFFERLCMDYPRKGISSFSVIHFQLSRNHPFMPPGIFGGRIEWKKRGPVFRTPRAFFMAPGEGAFAMLRR